MTATDANPTQVEWTGGAYPEREGLTVRADADGITVSAWYDGGSDLEFEGRLSWEELDGLRRSATGDT